MSTRRFLHSPATHLCTLAVWRRKGDAITLHQGVNHAEVDAHVSQALGAGGAGVVVACVVGEAMGVHEVPTDQLL